MQINDLKILYQKNSNEKKAGEMAAYMRNRFLFFGIQKPKRSELEKVFINDASRLSIDKIFNLADQLIHMEQREFTYTALRLLEKNLRKMEFSHILKMKDFARVHSWWDSVDGYVGVIKKWFKLHPDYIKQFIDMTYDDEDFWIKRMSIICQLQLKETTDTTSMEKAILHNIHDPEFFIQKAIGWILRDYSKTNRQWVARFIREHREELSKMAIREGSKYL